MRIELAAPQISVVVCTYRRAEKLTACLDALARQTIRDRVEVIVVDDGPDDATAAVASRHDVRLIRHPQNRGLAAARNTGIEAATAPIVAFTDDDCVPADDWLEALARALRGCRRGRGRRGRRSAPTRDARPPVPRRDEPAGPARDRAQREQLAGRIGRSCTCGGTGGAAAPFPGPAPCTRSSAPTCRSAATRSSRSACSTSGSPSAARTKTSVDGFGRASPPDASCSRHER